MKKIGIVSTLISEKKFEGPFLKLCDEFKRYGIDCELLRYGEFKFFIGEDISLYYKNSPFNVSDFSLFIFKLGFSNPARGDLYLLDYFKFKRIPFFNGVNSYLLAKSKFATRMILKKNGFPVPETFLFRRFEDVKKIDLEFPVLVKPDTGSKGKDIYFCPNRMCVRNIFEKVWGEDRNKILLVEKFYRSVGNVHNDIRVFVLGENVVGAMKRIANKGGFISNYSLGNIIEPVELTPELVDLAVKSSKTLGLYMSGVDIMETENGPIILEVNGNPGIEGISTVNSNFFKNFVEIIKKDFNF